jgi:ATP-dependent RNA helicase RhlE
MQDPKFSDFALQAPILRAVEESGYTTPTPIQAQSIPPLLEGRDLLGCAQTGTGKTAAFALPILNLLTQQNRHLERKQVRVLVLSPTRELALQIHESFMTYGKHIRVKTSVAYGGVSINMQAKHLSSGVDVLVATPGRLLDLIRQKLVQLNQLSVLVLDEADRMLDMGFIGDIRQIVSIIPKKRQTLLFSATMPKEIKSLAESLLTDPVRVQVAPVSSTSMQIEQKVMFVDRQKKRDLLLHLLGSRDAQKVIVFTRTKHGANRLVEMLSGWKIPSDAIHGNKTQGARQKALMAFRRGQARVLVATDIMARGIDVDDVSHVINYDIPNEPESYVHRIGRTGRASARGMAIALCEGDERQFLRNIEKLIGKPIPVDTEHPFHSEGAANARGLKSMPYSKGNYGPSGRSRGKKSSRGGSGGGGGGRPGGRSKKRGFQQRGRSGGPGNRPAGSSSHPAQRG